MSELHSETNDATRGLIVRVKLVNLSHSTAAATVVKRPSVEQISEECLTAIVGLRANKNTRTAPPEIQHPPAAEYSPSETCMLTGQRVPIQEFEGHIEQCSICGNRVDLQLDFMETLKVAISQRRASQDSERVRGAMLVSAPEMNFAVCGELELG